MAVVCVLKLLHNDFYEGPAGDERGPLISGYPLRDSTLWRMPWTVTIIEYSGRSSTLFHQQEEAPGTAFWHPRGATLCRLIENYIRCEMHRGGFREVRTPQLLSRSLWERSGHWGKFGANMFEFADDGRRFALKPMNARATCSCFGNKPILIAICRCDSPSSAPVID